MSLVLQNTVPINVCGQELVAKPIGQESFSLQVLKETVQEGIGLQHDWILFYDSNGSKLLTDDEVHLAISEGRTPINATISDHAVHDFQQRQGEFTHMQLKVMRDQFKVLGLQVVHLQTQVKVLTDQAKMREDENARMMGAVQKQLGTGLAVVGECKISSNQMEELVKKCNESIGSLQIKIGEESLKKDQALHDLECKMERLNKAQQHENASLTEALNVYVEKYREAHDQVGQDVQVLQSKIEATIDLANNLHADALKQVSEAKTVAAQALSDAKWELIKQAHDDTEVQVNELANRIADFETRIVRTETLASDTSKKWVSSQEGSKEQYSANSQAIEQCRLQNRTNNAATQEMQRKLESHGETMQSLSTSMKQEQQRERRAREEQIRSLQKDVNGTLKSALAELEQRLNKRVDREADARTASICQVLDDMGEVLEKDVPSKIRSNHKRIITRTEQEDLVNTTSTTDDVVLSLQSSVRTPQYPGPALMSGIPSAVNYYPALPERQESIAKPGTPLWNSRNIVQASSSSVRIQHSPGTTVTRQISAGQSPGRVVRQSSSPPGTPHLSPVASTRGAQGPSGRPVGVSYVSRTASARRL